MAPNVKIEKTTDAGSGFVVSFTFQSSVETVTHRPFTDGVKTFLLNIHWILLFPLWIGSSISGEPSLEYRRMVNRKHQK